MDIDVKNQKVKFFCHFLSHIISILILGVTGCSGFTDLLEVPLDGLYSNNSKISGYSNSYSMINSEQSIENGVFRAGLGEFNGMDTVWRYTAGTDEMVLFSYLLSVSSGKVKLVLIAADGDLTVIAENSDDGAQEEITEIELSLPEGENRIKIVASKSRDLELEIQCGVGELDELGMDWSDDAKP